MDEGSSANLFATKQRSDAGAMQRQEHRFSQRGSVATKCRNPLGRQSMLD
ncbi:hypothetical protein ACFSDB_12290 [Planococcus chinensis]|uniref:Uncharacterized protein n=1 Tax=Planococcus chinensis TaxID=272917 RepID=A0ABW4QJ85_9BACL